MADSIPAAPHTAAHGSLHQHHRSRLVDGSQSGQCPSATRAIDTATAASDYSTAHNHTSWCHVTTHIRLRDVHHLFQPPSAGSIVCTAHPIALHQPANVKLHVNNSTYMHAVGCQATCVHLLSHCRRDAALPLQALALTRATSDTSQQGSSIHPSIHPSE
jgi:hypothetical protein